MGLAGSWAHENAEWWSAMLGHAGIRNGICQIIDLGARDTSRRGGIGLEGLEARESRGASFCFIHTFSSNFSVLREGVSRETRSGDTPPAPSLQGRNSGDTTPLRQALETKAVCNHSVPLSTGAGILPHRQNRKLKELRQGFGRYKACRNCGCERRQPC